MFANSLQEQIYKKTDHIRHFFWINIGFTLDLMQNLFYNITSIYLRFYPCRKSGIITGKQETLLKG